MSSLRFFLLLTLLLGSSYASESPWSGSLSSTLSTDLKRDTNPEKSIDSAFEFTLSYKEPTAGSFLLYTSYNKNLNQNREGDFGLSFLQYAPHSYSINDQLSFTANLRYYLPLDERKRDDHTYRGTFRFAPGLSWSPTKKLSLALSFSFGQNLHRLKQRADGSWNIRHYLSEGLSLNYQALERLGFSLYISNLHRFRYDGERIEDTFLLISSINFDFYERFTASLGYSNQALTFRTGTEEVGDLISSQTGSIYLTLGASF